MSTYTDEEIKMIGQHRIDLLNDIEAGLSYQEIADKHQIPIGTVKSRIHRARALLLSKADVDQLVEGE